MYKKYSIAFLVLFTVIILTSATINYITDETGIINRNISLLRETEISQHFVKMRYLLENPDKYSAYCFGSSRVGKIDLKKIDDGNVYYNMTYSEGVPEEWRDDIKMMIEHSVKVKKILLGIDDFSFMVNPKSHKKDSLRVPYTENNMHTYLAQFLQKPKFSKLKKLHQKPVVLYDVHDSGRPIHMSYDDWIEGHIEEHIHSERFKSPCTYSGNHMDAAVDAIRDIKEMCDEHGIQLIAFINPIHYLTYRENYPKGLNAFKKRIVEITPFYDFSGLNRITTKNYYYYETSHYRPIVGDMIIRRIFDPENAPKDFGTYVTKDNINEHIANMEGEMKSAE